MAARIAATDVDKKPPSETGAVEFCARARRDEKKPDAVCRGLQIAFCSADWFSSENRGEVERVRSEIILGTRRDLRRPLSTRYNNADRYR